MNHYEVDPQENQFKVIFVDVTHRCNMACANCYIPNRKIPDMDLAKLYEFVEKLPNQVTFRIIGGEPTLREDLPEIIFRLRAMGHKTTLFTNGLKLADLKYVKLLKQAGLDRAQLSMNGGSVDEVYQVMDNLRSSGKKIEALQNLISQQIITCIGMIVSGSGASNLAISSVVSLIEESFEKFAPSVDKKILIPSLRFRSIGKVGRYMDEEMPFETLLDIVAKNLNLPFQKFESAECGIDYFRRSSGKTPSRSVKSIISSKVGPIHIKVTDWKVDEDGVVESGNSQRGRITKNWKLAPFFEDVKVNEFGY